MQCLTHFVFTVILHGRYFCYLPVTDGDTEQPRGMRGLSQGHVGGKWNIGIWAQLCCTSEPDSFQGTVLLGEMGTDTREVPHACYRYDRSRLL